MLSLNSMMITEIGYMIDLSRTEMDMLLYSNFITPLISF